MTGVDMTRLAAWMDDQQLPAGPIVEVEPLGGGTQNIVLGFARGGQRYVLRHPPVHKRSNSDETMRREARVLAALATTDVPHPRLIAACSDTAALGSAFYLMEPIDGSNPRVALPPAYVADRRWRRELGLAMADGAASIGSVDHIAIGLADLGRAEGYLERQVPRWQAQLDSYGELAGYPGPDIPGIDRIAAWLDDNRPRSSRPGLIHGDYHMANVLVAHDRPALAAIVDWELTTIGDPLLDLGWLLATWPTEGDEAFNTTRVEPWDGFPEPAELIDRYAEHSDRDLSRIVWYEVLACYKLGILLEGTFARACAGLAALETGERLHARTIGLFKQAHALIVTG
jgi:aminoglycoside phosphotransferase (APT) family kinase protein